MAEAGKWSCYRVGAGGAAVSRSIIAGSDASITVALHGLTYREARELLAFWAGAASEELIERGEAFAQRYDVARAEKDDFMPLPGGRKGRRARDGEWVLSIHEEARVLDATLYAQYLVMEEDGVLGDAEQFTFKVAPPPMRYTYARESSLPEVAFRGLNDEDAGAPSGPPDPDEAPVSRPRRTLKQAQEEAEETERRG